MLKSICVHRYGRNQPTDETNRRKEMIRIFYQFIHLNVTIKFLEQNTCFHVNRLENLDAFFCYLKTDHILYLQFNFDNPIEFRYFPTISVRIA